MIDDYMLDKVLDKIKMIIGIENLRILRFWLNQIINCQMLLCKMVIVILITCVIEDDRFYPQIFLEEALVA